MPKGKTLDEKSAYEMAEAAAALGARLAGLVSLLKISDEGKDAFFELLEECALEELVIINDLLEVWYVEYETAKEDEKFAKEVERVRARWEKKEGRLAEHALVGIQKLEEALDKKVATQGARV